MPEDSPQVDINNIAMESLRGVVEYSRDTLLYAIEQHSVSHYTMKLHLSEPHLSEHMSGNRLWDGEPGNGGVQISEASL